MASAAMRAPIVRLVSLEAGTVAAGGAVPGGGRGSVPRGGWGPAPAGGAASGGGAEPRGASVDESGENAGAWVLDAPLVAGGEYPPVDPPDAGSGSVNAVTGG